ncbi:hypothetical protein J6590_009289 [Homalodisca vitripennis]|nr:hypothetical protein J6590_009289 [Homalodisca vitripennis]
MRAALEALHLRKASQSTHKASSQTTPTVEGSATAHSGTQQTRQVSWHSCHTSCKLILCAYRQQYYFLKALGHNSSASTHSYKGQF